MAYLRLGCIKQSGGSNMHAGLKNALYYIFNPKKTNGNEYVGGYNMLITRDNCRQLSYDQMIDTKEAYGKTDKRQAYHYKLSFSEKDPVTPELALQITHELCERCFYDYECAYSVHTNTEHMHSHIVFNSVGLDGYKYRYEKGDWAISIQPIVNDICNKYGLETLALDLDPEVRIKCKKYDKWAESAGKQLAGSAYPNSRIKDDIDSCISEAGSYAEFVELMKLKGHEYDDSHKYITVKAPGRSRATRIINLSPDKYTYTKENIINMIDGIYPDRKEVINKMFEDWNKYNSTTKVRFMKKYDLDLLRLNEELELLVENKIGNIHALKEYAAYISAADRELNIIRKRITNSMKRHQDAYEALDTIVLHYKGFALYKEGDMKFKADYEICMDAFKSLSQYDIEKLINYREHANRVLKQIDDYKKHIYVNKKIVNRIREKSR